MVFDRREKIIAMLNRDGMVKVSELVELFQVSVETIQMCIRDRHISQPSVSRRCVTGRIFPIPRESRLSGRYWPTAV